MIRVLTHLGGARATIVTGLVLAVAGGEARQAGLAALIGNALSHLAVQVLKRAVARPRPCDAWGRPLATIDLPDPFSFPSGHAAAAFATALPVAVQWPVAGSVAVGLAAVVAASRVRLRVHYASDVVAGVVLGMAGAVAAHQLLG